ncbi:MAG: TetR/AcrR family transcriptional regulator [Burkholderiaceae bacterium]|jgi:AcrR family transcriptional regulator|nr:TetR/AcrR family transcriptional regulator [Burkholderiaceae bacterium]
MARPRAADFDQHRDAILAMAARLFADRGYAAGSIAELAQACGVSKALLYHYYRDKEQLLFDIADRYIDSLLVIVDEVAAEALPPPAHLRRLIERFMAAYEHAAAYHRVLVQDVKYLSAPHRRRVNGKQNRVVEAFAEAIAAVAPQLAKAALLKPVTMTLFGMINWTFTWLKEAGPLTYAQMAPVVADLFIAGVGAVGQPLRAGAARRALAAANVAAGEAAAMKINGHGALAPRARVASAARRPAAAPPPVPPQLPRATGRRPPRRRAAAKSTREST